MKLMIVDWEDSPAKSRGVLILVINPVNIKSAIRTN